MTSVAPGTGPNLAVHSDGRCEFHVLCAGAGNFTAPADRSLIRRQTGFFHFSVQFLLAHAQRQGGPAHVAVGFRDHFA